MGSSSAVCEARCRSGQNTEGCTGTSHGDHSPARRKDIVLAGGICCLLGEPTDAMSAATERRHFRGCMAEGTNTPILEFREKILYMPAKPARGRKWEPRFHPGVFVDADT